MFTGVQGEKIGQKSCNPWVHLASWLDKYSGALTVWRAAYMETTDLLVPCSVLYTLNQMLHVSVLPPSWFFFDVEDTAQSAVHLHALELLENERFLSLPVHQFCPM